jgi:hypothetical protein
MAKSKSTSAKFKRYAAPQGQPKVLLFDIETAPIIAHVWGLWENNVGLSQIQSDWHCLSWSAKWKGAPEAEVMYMDQRNAKKVEDDTDLLEAIWELLDEADVVITQNGKSFDQKKLNARFVIMKIKDRHPPSSYKHEDTKLIAQRHFNFPSFKLEYMTDKLCVKYKKLKHKNFPGHEMWTECLKGNIDAWKEMELYNKHDVLALEELYDVLAPWHGNSGVNFNLYNDEEGNLCKCGSASFIKNGFYRTNVGKYQKYKCKQCGAETRDRQNLFSKEKRASLQMPTVR